MRFPAPSLRPLALLSLIAVSVAGTIIASQAVAKVFNDQTQESRSATLVDKDLRIREGTTVERLHGNFKLTGDRVTFVSVEGKRFGGLENLALERVARTVKDAPGQLHWTVAGVITEFRGTNYLLLTHAVLADKQRGLSDR